MKEAEKTFKEGEIVAVSNGCYSDYCVRGLFKVKCDFDAGKQLEVWASETGRKLECGRFENDYEDYGIDFLPWLSRNGFIEDINYRELHTGDYSVTELTLCR